MKSFFKLDHATMKSTVFEFELQATGVDSLTLKTIAGSTAQSIDGVVDIEFTDGVYSISMLVTAQFSDAKAAKKLHSKLVSMLTKIDRFKVVGMRTTLSDIFE